MIREGGLWPAPPSLSTLPFPELTQAAGWRSTRLGASSATFCARPHERGELLLAIALVHQNRVLFALDCGLSCSLFLMAVATDPLNALPSELRKPAPHWLLLLLCLYMAGYTSSARKYLCELVHQRCWQYAQPRV